MIPCALKAAGYSLDFRLLFSVHKKIVSHQAAFSKQTSAESVNQLYMNTVCRWIFSAVECPGIYAQRVMAGKVDTA